jgi:hypothetical protein
MREELDTGVCSESNQVLTLDFNGNYDLGDGEVVWNFDGERAEVLNGYVEGNKVVPCIFAVTELLPVGWHLLDIEVASNPRCGPGGPLPSISFDNATAVVTPQFGESDCEVDFYNGMVPVPLIVTKTFTGRDYYTTIDRADFHLYTPGLCGTFPMDPFGGLLGSIGVFRTINASQLPQVVMALPTIIPAGPAGSCTYRIQENNAPDGCVALDPDGSNADGPYWEQTWVFGETTEMNFNIVNDCAETPEPTPTPDVAPTTTPKKPGAKKPSSGGTAAPKFTG